MKRKERANRALVTLARAVRRQGIPIGRGDWQDRVMDRVRNRPFRARNASGPETDCSDLGRMLPVACTLGLGALTFGIAVLSLLQRLDSALARDAVRSTLYTFTGYLGH